MMRARFVDESNSSIRTRPATSRKGGRSSPVSSW